MNTDTEAWREVFGFAEREIASLKDKLVSKQSEEETGAKRAEIVAWQKVLKIGEKEAPKQAINFWGTKR